MSAIDAGKYSKLETGFTEIGLLLILSSVIIIFETDSSRTGEPGSSVTVIIDLISEHLVASI